MPLCRIDNIPLVRFNYMFWTVSSLSLLDARCTVIYCAVLAIAIAITVDCYAVNNCCIWQQHQKTLRLEFSRRECESDNQMTYLVS